jgi:ion channel-forming bestrophin family protein
VATKHHLRGEDGIHYTDLYHLVKFLPPYTWSLARTSTMDPRATMFTSDSKHDSYAKATTSPAGSYISHRPGMSMRQGSSVSSMTMVGPPDTSPPIAASFHNRKPSQTHSFTTENTQYAWRVNEERFLLPARLPPKYSFLHLFPFSLFLKFLAKERNRKQVRGMYYAGLREKKDIPGAQNIPLEISLYLVSVNLHLPRSAAYLFYSA